MRGIMKARSALLGVVFMLTFGVLSVWAETQPKDLFPGVEKCQPGVEHQMLKKLEGNYQVTVKCWMDPAKVPMETQGEAKLKMILEGRFLRQEFKGELMGKTIHGTGFDGFDRTTGKYVTVWMDDSCTQMMFATGTSKDNGKTIEYTGEHGDPQAGQAVKVRSVFTQLDKDRFTFEMFQTREGKEVKGMELLYTRKQ